jgi:hypothetical protein
MPELALQPGEKSFIYGKHFSAMNEDESGFFLPAESRLLLFWSLPR